jgi:Domain of unknown function (DUF4443)
MIDDRRYVSRESLNLVDGTIRTMIEHLKMQELIDTSNIGTKLSAMGVALFAYPHLSLLDERIPMCSVALGKFDYAVLLKNLTRTINSGIEQRDAAVKMCASGATTPLFRNCTFVIRIIILYLPKSKARIYKLLIQILKPRSNDVLIIGSDRSDWRNTQMAGKSAALFTMMNHEKHV